MQQFFDTLQDINGNALNGISPFVQGSIVVTAFPGGGGTTIYSDNGLSAIAASTVNADATGQVSFYAPDNDYIVTYKNQGTTYKTRSPVTLFDGAEQLTMADTGTANVYAVTDSRLEKVLRTGLRVNIQAGNANTGASTFQYNALALKNIQNPDASSLQANQMVAGGIYLLEYTGVYWQFKNTVSSGFITQTVFPRTTGEIAASFTPSTAEYRLQPLNPMAQRYGAVGNNNGTVANGTDDTAALAVAWGVQQGYQVLCPLDGGGLSYRVQAISPTPPIPAGFQMLNGGIVADQLVNTSGDQWSVVGIGGGGVLSKYTYIPEFYSSSGPNFAAGNHLVAIGWGSQSNVTSGRRNVSVGSRTMLGATTSYYCTALGSHVMENLTTGYENTGVGVQSLQSCTSGYGNTGCGLSTLNKLTTGFYNTALGWDAMTGTTSLFTGSYNIAVGFQPLFNITTGLDNVAIGRSAQFLLTSGTGNVSVGDITLNVLTTTNNNTAIGYSALSLCTTAANTAVGFNSLLALSSGTNCTAVGAQAGQAMTTANGGTFIGYQSGLNVTGASNTLVGSAAGATLTTGASNTGIGTGVDFTAGGNNSSCLGNGAVSTGSNQIVLGNASIATIYAQVTTITMISDSRDKTNIVDLALGLEFIESLRPVRYTWAMRDGSKIGMDEAGFIAQDLKLAQERADARWFGLVDETDPDCMRATPGKILYPTVRAVQQLAARNRILEERIVSLERRLVA